MGSSRDYPRNPGILSISGLRDSRLPHPAWDHLGIIPGFPGYLVSWQDTSPACGIILGLSQDSRDTILSILAGHLPSMWDHPGIVPGFPGYLVSWQDTSPACGIILGLSQDSRDTILSILAGHLPSMWDHPGIVPGFPGYLVSRDCETLLSMWDHLGIIL